MRKRKLLLAATIIAGVLLITSAAVLMNPKEKKDVSKKNLTAHSSKKTEVKKNEVKEEDTKKEIIKNEKPKEEETNKNTASGEVNYKCLQKYDEFFKDDVFIGDSITEGISEFDFLPEKNVLAKLGLNLTQLDTEIAKAESLQPKRVFLLMGSNDLEYEGTTPNIFKERYRTVIKEIKAKIPNGKIYVESIFPVLPIAARRNSIVNNDRINQFNEAIKSMAEEESITYLDTASIVNDRTKEYYESDGEHFKSKFYNIWLNFIEAHV